MKWEHTSLTTGFTAILAVSTIIYTYNSCKQLRHMTEQTDVLRKTLELAEGADLLGVVKGPHRLRTGANEFLVHLYNPTWRDATQVSFVRLGYLIARAGEPPIFGEASESVKEARIVHPRALEKEGATYTFLRFARVHLDERDLAAIASGNLLYVYATVRYWNGFSSRRLNVCGTYWDGCKPHMTEDGRTWCVLNGCDFPVEDSSE
jgi:hypothetical protein